MLRFVVGLAALALLVPAAASAYSWPIRPFFQQHPVRGYFNDPRLAGPEQGFHFGVDIVAADHTPGLRGRERICTRPWDDGLGHSLATRCSSAFVLACGAASEHRAIRREAATDRLRRGRRGACPPRRVEERHVHQPPADRRARALHRRHGAAGAEAQLLRGRATGGTGGRVRHSSRSPSMRTTRRRSSSRSSGRRRGSRPPSSDGRSSRVSWRSGPGRARSTSAGSCSPSASSATSTRLGRTRTARTAPAGTSTTWRTNSTPTCWPTAPTCSRWRRSTSRRTSVEPRSRSPSRTRNSVEREARVLVGLRQVELQVEAPVRDHDPVGVEATRDRDAAAVQEADDGVAALLRIVVLRVGDVRRRGGRDVDRGVALDAVARLEV